MALKIPFLRPKTVDTYPPPNTYREFDVPGGGATIGAVTSAAGYIRDRKTLSAPQSYYRATALAIRNLSAFRVKVEVPGRQNVYIPAGTTDIVSGGNTFIEFYRVTPEGGDLADKELFIVEKCRSWAGWNVHRQDVG